MTRRHIRFNDQDHVHRSVPRVLHHPFFSWAGLRPVLAQHTSVEHQALQRYARNRLQVVEIGVAEGASAIALRDGMDPQGHLYLVDPYHLSRVRAINFLRRAARRAVSNNGCPNIIWIEKFSHQAVEKWSKPIDFLLIDGDHAEHAVQQDWDDWHPYVIEGGIVAFHDARLFPSGWTSPVYGPVKFINRAFRASSHPRWQIIDEVDSLVFQRRGSDSTNATKAGA